MKKWYVYGKKADFQELGEKLSLDPVLVRILRNRDLTTEEEMRNFLEGEEIPSPLFLPDSIRFLNRLERMGRKFALWETMMWTAFVPPPYWLRHFLFFSPKSSFPW